jgi:hypothetical protein
MSSGTTDEQSDLTPFLTRAAEDLFSQAGRIVPDVGAVRDIVMTAFTGGIIDDHKYIVSLSNISCNILL